MDEFEDYLEKLNEENPILGFLIWLFVLFPLGFIIFGIGVIGTFSWIFAPIAFSQGETLKGYFAIFCGILVLFMMWLHRDYSTRGE